MVVAGEKKMAVTLPGERPFDAKVSVSELINSLGEQGWELTTSFAANASKVGSVAFLFFKRPKA